MTDESFRLNGKQLVFTFMTATVVAVVVFLCGVMVGRGLGDRQALVEPAPAPVDDFSVLDPAEVDDVLSNPAPAESDGLAITEILRPLDAGGGMGPASAPRGDLLPEPVVEELRAEAPAGGVTAPSAGPPTRPADTGPSVTPGAEPRAGATPPVRAQPAASRPTAAPAAPSAGGTTAAGRTEPPARTATPAGASAGAGSASTEVPFTVQVAAVRARGEADAIVGRLVARGYPAYVSTPPAGGPTVFRVRVGQFRDRAEAQSMASRLETQERFKPWITH